MFTPSAAVTISQRNDKILNKDGSDDNPGLCQLEEVAYGIDNLPVGLPAHNPQWGQGGEHNPMAQGQWEHASMRDLGQRQDLLVLCSDKRGVQSTPWGQWEDHNAPWQSSQERRMGADDLPADNGENQFNGWLTTSRRDTQWVVKKQALWQSPWMTTTCATIWRWERCPRFSVDTRYKCYKSTRHTSTSSPWRNRITSEWSSWATTLQTSSRSTNGPMAGSGCMATQCTLRRWCRSRVRTIIRQFSTWPSTTWVNTVRAACHKQYNSASRTTRLQTESTPSMCRFQDANKRGMKIMHNMSKRRQWWSRKRGLMRRP